MPVRTEAIVLRLVNFSNTSRVLALYTERAGQVRAIAKGLRRRRSLFAPMDLFSRNEIVYYPRRGLALSILKESFELDAHRAIGSSLARLYAASAAAELLLWGTPVDEADPALWALARGVFERLARGEASARAVLAAFAFGFLKRTGHGPVVDRCVECGARGRRSPAFVPAAGGLVCPPCRRAHRLEGLALGREVVEALARLDAAGGEAIWDVPLAAGAARRILVALLAHAQRALEAPLDGLRLAEERAA